MKLVFIILGISFILNSYLSIATIHFYKKYKELKNEYTICTSNLEKVTNDYNNLLNEYTTSLQRYKENLSRLNKRTHEIRSLVDRYKEIRIQGNVIDNECEQLKIMLDEFVKIDNEIRPKLGGQK